MAIDRSAIDAVAGRTGYQPTADDVRWAQNIDSITGRVFECSRSGRGAVVLDAQDCRDLVILWRSQQQQPAP